MPCSLFKILFINIRPLRRTITIGRCQFICHCNHLSTAIQACFQDMNVSIHKPFSHIGILLPHHLKETSDILLYSSDLDGFAHKPAGYRYDYIFHIHKSSIHPICSHLHLHERFSCLQSFVCIRIHHIRGKS